MTFQPHLFDGLGHATALARNTDPATSHEAARNHRDGAARNKAVLLDALMRCAEPVTAVELWQRLDDNDHERIGRHEVSRRLSDLAHERLVVRCEARPCRVNGTRMGTWRAT